MKAEDTTWLAEVADQSIGVVRVSPQYGTLVLRGTRISEEWRRRGIGTPMWRLVGERLGKRECCCVAYAHLAEFYGQIGSAQVTTAATPSFPAEPVTECRKRELSVAVLVRPANI